MTKTYSEVSSTFSSDGKVYDLNLLFKLSQSLPVQLIEVDKLRWVLQYDPPRKDRVAKANPDFPVLVTQYKGQELLVDGIHRLQKAINLGRTLLPYRRLTEEMMASAEISTKNTNHK